MEEHHEWDLIPDDLFNILSHDIVIDDIHQTPSSATNSSILGSQLSAGTPRQDVGARTSASGMPKAMPNSTGASSKATASPQQSNLKPSLERHPVSAIVERICRSRSESSTPRTGPNLVARARFNVCHAALGPGTWSPLSRPLVHQDRIVVGTETAQVRGPENYRSMTGLILCEAKVPWKRRDTSKTIHAETDFVGTDSAIQDIQWVKPGESCVYATESELSVCGFESRRKHLIEVRDPHDRIRQIAVSQDRMVSGGFDEKICLYALGDQGRNGMHMYWDMRGIVGGVAWHPSDASVVTYTLDTGEFGMIDIRSSSREPSLRCDLGRANLYAHCAVTETMCALGYGTGYGSLIDLRRASDVPVDLWRDPTLTAIGELIDSSTYGVHSRNSVPLVVAAGIGGLSVWDFSNGEAKCLGQGNPLPEYKDFPFPSIGFKTSGVFVSNQDMVYAQTDAAGYFSLYDVGLF